MAIPRASNAARRTNPALSVGSARHVSPAHVRAEGLIVSHLFRRPEGHARPFLSRRHHLVENAADGLRVRLEH